MKKICLFSIVFGLAFSTLEDCAASKRGGDAIDDREYKKTRIEAPISTGKKHIIDEIVPTFLSPKEDISENVLTYEAAYNTLKDYTQSFTDDQCYQLLTRIKDINSWMESDNLKLLWKHYFSSEAIKALSTESKFNILNLFGCSKGDEIYFLGDWDREGSEIEKMYDRLIQSGITLNKLLQENKKYIRNQESFWREVVTYEVFNDSPNYLEAIIQSIQTALDFGSTYNFDALIKFPFLLTETESKDYFLKVKAIAPDFEGLFLNAGNFKRIHKLGLPVIQVASRQDHLKGKSIGFILDWCEQIPESMCQSCQPTLSYLELIHELYHERFNQLLTDMELIFNDDILDYLQQNQIQRENILKLIDLLDPSSPRRLKVFEFVKNLYRCSSDHTSSAWRRISSESGFNILEWFFKLDKTHPQVINLAEVDKLIISEFPRSKTLLSCPIDLLDWFVDYPSYLESNFYPLHGFLRILGKKTPDIYQSDRGLRFIKNFIKRADSFEVILPRSSFRALLPATTSILTIIPKAEIFVEYLISLQNDPIREQLWLKINELKLIQPSGLPSAPIDYAVRLAESSHNLNDPQLSENIIKLLEYLAYSESNEMFKTAVYYCQESKSEDLNATLLVLEHLKFLNFEDRLKLLTRALKITQAFPNIPPKSKLELVTEALHKIINFEDLLKFIQKIVQESGELDLLSDI